MCLSVLAGSKDETGGSCFRSGGYSVPDESMLDGRNLQGGEYVRA